MPRSIRALLPSLLGALLAIALSSAPAVAQEPKHSRKPPLHGRHWVAITGKPLAATAGSLTFAKGGNAVDAACAMLAASATMWDSLAWGGETQALIHDPTTGEVYAINALGAAPSGATPEYFRRRGLPFPPDYGPLAAVTPGTPGGLLVMLAEFGTLSLAEVLEPAIEMADGYPMEAVQAESIEASKSILDRWQSSREVLLPNYKPTNPTEWAAPRPGEIFRQPQLKRTLQELVEAERVALAAGQSRADAIMAAYDRFYRGDIAEEIVASTQAAGGLFTMQDLDEWQVHVEEPVKTSYKGIDVYKLDSWVQGPVMLQMLNMIEDLDLEAMGYNSTRYIHTLYQVMNLAFADRDFYYGDPYFPPEEPIEGLLSKEYARERAALIDPSANRPYVGPGDPYPFQGETNPFESLRERWSPRIAPRRTAANGVIEPVSLMSPDEAFRAGTTSIQAADADGWAVSITPSGGWIPAFIAGDTGVGLSQRMQSFDMERSANPFNVLEPGKRPRATLTPGMALRDGEPYLSFAVQGGDSQDQNLLQFFLNVVEFGMNVQQAAEAANFNSYQMHSSFGDHRSEPGRLVVRDDTSPWVVRDLERMGYHVETWEQTSGPITAIEFDSREGSLWGGASDYGDDYGIAW